MCMNHCCRVSFQNVLGSVLVLISVSSCTMVGPDYHSPNTVTPDKWHQSLPGATSSNRAEIQAWWRNYNDSKLNRLIGLAEGKNLTLAQAKERIEQARAARTVARSGLFPFVDGTGGYTRSRTTENGSSSFGGVSSDTYSLGFDTGWEIDFWGRNRRLVEAAAANEAASVEFMRDALVSLYAEVAVTYLEIRTVEERIQITRRNLGTQKDSVKLAQERLDAGLVPEQDVTQAQANQANTEATIPQLRQQRAAALSRLAVLLGMYPGEVDRLIGTSAKIPMPAKSVTRGLPADLLRARPDLRAAERSLAAATANIGVQKAELYPQFTLGGTFALQAASSRDVLESGSRNYGFGPGFRWQLFSAGRVKSLVKIEESRTREAYHAYENAVLTAVSEVESSMAELSEERNRLAALDRALEAAKKSNDLIKRNYKNGLVPFQNVLDAERVVLQTEDNRAFSRGKIAAAYARLYKALGGGARVQSK
ncbi:efflux transporter, outer membrane factor (OMF) lipoprotein, NodT family [Rubritalea squalenifaciens DSM 18772]|uniref:Efflux transporter, outer membrane factor (OMF) lipoprotein, NodT family n=1 Tax=Rubritalea squalenifaciens DSM 18772 TaxID=1123071 RepID=A0A1M6L098_9BACT|nr:efflux transporter, outer membrane factor (OMF) lipoprotein, NodT family [Rubritalea squalenifaciens DSM 18772]